MWSHHATETVRNIVSGCKKLAQRKYRQRHDRVALRVHWEMCRKYGIECNDKCYDNQPLPTAENGEVRITWDTTIDTDKVLKHNRPDITLVHKDTQKCTLIDIAVPADQNIPRAEEEKVEKYQKLAFEIRRNHGDSKVTIILLLGLLLLEAYQKVQRPGLASEMYLTSLEVYNYRALLTCCGKWRG